MNKFVIALLMLLLPITVCSQTKAKVIEVSDGDTVTVLLKNNKKLKLRLAEVDCPEKGQPFGKNAKQFTAEQIFGKHITFTKTGKDRYGRNIAKIHYDKGKYLSAELIKNGFGWWYYSYSKNKELGILEAKARSKKLGLWQDKKAISPWDYRRNKRIRSEKTRLMKDKPRNT